MSMLFGDKVEMVVVKLIFGEYVKLLSISSIKS